MDVAPENILIIMLCLSNLTVQPLNGGLRFSMHKTDLTATYTRNTLTD